METSAHIRLVDRLTTMFCAPALEVDASGRRDRRRCRGWEWRRHIVGFGIATKRVHGRWTGDTCVTMFVRSKRAVRGLRRAEIIPERLVLDAVEADVLTDVVAVDGRFVAHGALVRPLRPGAEVGHQRGGKGTLGLLVRKPAEAGVMFGLSCSHVIARSGHWKGFGDQVEQPAGDSAGSAVIGQLTNDFSTLRVGELATADAALVRLSEAADPRLLTSGVVLKQFSTQKAEEFKAGTRTVLHGTVSKQAKGQVIAFRSTWEIAKVPFVSGPVTFSGLVAYETACAKGDSGAAVTSEAKPGEAPIVFGIHTAGRDDGQLGLFQPISPILTAFSVQLAAAPGA